MEKSKTHTFRKDDQTDLNRNRHLLYSVKQKQNSTSYTLQEEAQLKRLDKMSRRKKRDSRMNLY